MHSLLSLFSLVLVNVVEEENGTILPILYECLICIRVFISTFKDLFMRFARTQSHSRRVELTVKKKKEKKKKRKETFESHAQHVSVGQWWCFPERGGK